MITLRNILKLVDFDLNTSTKLACHRESKNDLNELYHQGYFDEYQRVQRKPKFDGQDYIISFIGLNEGKSGRAKLVGVYKVIDKKVTERKNWSDGFPFPDRERGKYLYNLQKTEDLKDFNERLIIDWGGSRNWLHNIDTTKEVLEILPDGYVKPFPGYLDILLQYSVLQKIMLNRQANIEWYYKLSSAAGIYVIKDKKEKKLYVGSASGDEGIWGRWKNYANNGHGGNRKLKNLIEENSNHANNFEFSILRVLPKKNISKSELANIEQLYMDKLGSKATGLN